MTYDVTIVGGGIVGLATAHRLLEAQPQLKMLLLEKEAKLAAHQTGNNSGVLHSGLYYKPGSEKAKCAVQGLQQMLAFCRGHRLARTASRTSNAEKSSLPLSQANCPGWKICGSVGMQTDCKACANCCQSKSRKSSRTPPASRRFRCRRKASWIIRASAKNLVNSFATRVVKSVSTRASKKLFKTPAIGRSKLPPEISRQNLWSPAAGCTPTGWCGRRGKRRRRKSSRFAVSIFKSKRSGSSWSAI